MLIEEVGLLGVESIPLDGAGDDIGACNGARGAGLFLTVTAIVGRTASVASSVASAASDSSVCTRRPVLRLVEGPNSTFDFSSVGVSLSTAVPLRLRGALRYELKSMFPFPQSSVELLQARQV